MGIKFVGLTYKFKKADRAKNQNRFYGMYSNDYTDIKIDDQFKYLRNDIKTTILDRYSGSDPSLSFVEAIDRKKNQIYFIVCIPEARVKAFDKYVKGLNKRNNADPDDPNSGTLERMDFKSSKPFFQELPISDIFINVKSLERLWYKYFWEFSKKNPNYSGFRILQKLLYKITGREIPAEALVKMDIKTDIDWSEPDKARTADIDSKNEIIRGRLAAKRKEEEARHQAELAKIKDDPMSDPKIVEWLKLFPENKNKDMSEWKFHDWGWLNGESKTESDQRRLESHVHDIAKKLYPDKHKQRPLGYRGMHIGGENCSCGFSYVYGSSD